MAKIEGLEALAIRLKKMPSAVRKEVISQMDENAEDLRSRAQGLAPQLEGDLILSAQIL